jgi:uncharacterized repeat protein (TIGR03837 family)
MTVDILCRVVDNLGDIGFVYRLARSLSELSEAPRLRLIVDDLAAFAGLCPEVRADTGLQRVGEWTVARWDDPGEDALCLFRSERPRLVLECYACGRPDWFESVLFDPADPQIRHIVNLEYLTAESWAAEFHLLPSMTRSPLVRKSVFMPGICLGTGGLVMDDAFRELIGKCASPEGRLSVRRAAIEGLHTFDTSLSGVSESAFWFLVFSYEHDFTSIVADLAHFHSGRPLVAFVAAGRSSTPFFDAWHRAGKPFPAVALPLLEQPRWDAFLASADFSIVRGEESFARACLAGHPFLWECYPFAADTGTACGGQLPKVSAFLNVMRPFFEDIDFSSYNRLTLAFNGAEQVGAELNSAPGEPSPGDLLAVLQTQDAGRLDGFFLSFSREVRNLGNMAANLMTFLRDLG